METTLHRQLKAMYADDGSRCEVRVGSYRIDAVQGQRLVEIQHGSLAAIRRKLEQLLRQHDVLLVKPIIHRKLLVQLARRDGCELTRRFSPRRGGFLDFFSDLVYLARAFPHPRLAIEVALCDVEELRYAGQLRRRRRRGRWPKAFVVQDQRLTQVVETRRIATCRDLVALLPSPVPQPFHTGQLAEQIHAPRWMAQRIAYCLRETGAATVVGKQRNALLYRLKKPWPWNALPAARD